MVLERIESILQAEDLLVHNRVNVIGIDGAVHRDKLILRSDQDTTNDAACAENFEDTRLLFEAKTTQEADDRDDTAEFDS